MSRALVLSLSLSLLSTVARADYMDHFVVRDDVGLHKVPSQGPAELLVMPVEVAGHPALNLDRLKYFFSADDPNGFVQYYRAASLGRYQPHVTVGPVVHFDVCPLPPDTFPGCKVARGDLNAFSAGMEMIREVVKRTRDQGVDFKTLDVNGKNGTPDGYADGVVLLTNVPFGGIAFPFAFYNRGDNLNGATSGPLVVNGVRVPHVAIAGYSDEFVMVHEFGHLLGLTDLYSNVDAYEGLFFSQMGTWGYDAQIPLPDAESRLRLRWSNWHQVKGTQRVQVAPADFAGEVWKLGSGDEYFLVENRGPAAFDQAFTARGLAVYHVDRTVKLSGEEGRFQDRILDYVNGDPWRSYISNVQADRKFDLQLGAREPSYLDDLFREGDSLGSDPTEVPIGPDHQVVSSNFYSGRTSGISISDIQVRTDRFIDVTFTAPDEGDCESLCAEGDGCLPVSCREVPAPSGGGCQCQSGPGALALGLLALISSRRGPRRR